MLQKFVWNFLLAVILCAPALIVHAQATWMTDNAAVLSKKQLNEIALPGAHDAGTFAIETTKNSGINIGGGVRLFQSKYVSFFARQQAAQANFVVRFGVFRLGENAGAHDG